MMSTLDQDPGKRPGFVYILGSFGPSLVLFRGNLIRDLLKMGFRVAVGAPNLTLKLRKQLTAMGAEVHETPMSRAGISIVDDLRYYFQLKAMLLRDNPDLLLTYTIKPNIWGALAARRAGVRSIAMVTGLGYAFTDGSYRKSVKQRLVELFARSLYREATRHNYRVIFQNADDIADFVAAGCLEDKTKARLVSGSGVDMDHYSLVPLPEHPTVLMIARLLRNKGVREFAEAAASLKVSFPEARFQLIGPFDEGPDSISRSELESWEAAGLEYLGSVEDVRPAIAAARIYVLPSYREGTPRSVLEAMAMGRPVITTDVPGCRETVEDEVTGLLVPKNDAASLAAAIARLLAAPALAARMGEAGFRRASQKYDVRKVNEDLIREMDFGSLPR